MFKYSYSVKAATGVVYLNILTQFAHPRSIFWSRLLIFSSRLQLAFANVHIHSQFPINI